MRHRSHCPSGLEHVIASNGRSVAANFRDWFRNSKVVGSGGDPLVVYHGTAEVFDGFDKSCIGDNFRADETGFFFTSDPAIAGFYAESDTIGINKRAGAHVMPVYVALQRPLVVDDAFLAREGMHAIGVKDDAVSFWDTYQALVLEWAHKQPADGIILVDRRYLVNGEPSRMVVAFEPHQVKSAIGNSGLYAPFSGRLSDPAPAPVAAHTSVASMASRRRAMTS